MQSSIIAKIGLNSAGFKTGLAQCRAIAGNFKNQVGGLFSGIGSQIMGAMGISMGVAGFSAMAMKAIDAGSKITDMATHLRIGTTELQILHSLARDAGVDFSKLEMSLNNLNMRTIEAIDGNKTYKDAFDRLKISLTDFIKLPVEQRLEKLAVEYKETGASVQSLNDVSNILGLKAGSQTLEILDRLASDGLPKLTQAAIEAGQVMDEETVVALDNAGDEIARWQNWIIVAFGGFLADMGSSIGRQKWGYMIGLKFAQAGQYIEEALRNIGNYILATFSTIFRYLNGKFADFVIPIRNIYFGLVKSFYNGIATIVGLFSDSMEDAIRRALDGLEKVNRKVNELAKKDQNKSFMDIFTEEISNAQQKNSGRKKSDLWTSSSVDWWKKEIEQAEKLRKIEKEVIKQSEENRKRKYATADRSVKIKDSEEQKKSRDKKSKVQNYNDSSLAEIGGGDLTAARYDVSEKQLSETKKQSKILKQIAENTEPTKSKIELLMK